MTIPQAIEIAGKNRYTYKGKTSVDYSTGRTEAIKKVIWSSDTYCAVEDTVGFKFRVYYNNLFLDPLFWQALGRGMGWFCPFRHVHKDTDTCFPWHTKWHQLIDHLADGGTPESFFADIALPEDKE